jgi:uncharacterized membrane protein
LLIPLSILITEDVVFVPLAICWIPPTKIIHTIYLFVSTYFVPIFIAFIIYGIIYRRVIQSSTTSRQSSHVHKRDFKLIKNILILLVLFLVAGIPFLVAVIMTLTTSFQSLPFYFFPVLVGPSMCIVERICLIYLNKELRRETKKLLGQLHIIQPSNQVTVLAVPTMYTLH